jgi:ABC-type metal ion transport system, periplasmic component/surface adhesin
VDKEFQTRLAPVKGVNLLLSMMPFPIWLSAMVCNRWQWWSCPEDALTPKDVQRVKTVAQKFQVKALLSEPGVDDKRLQQIANELKLPVKTLDPLEGGKLEPDYYFQVMRQNLATLESVCK